MTRAKNKTDNMQIGDLAKKAGVSVRAIRYYEELGLLHPGSHSVGGFRLYCDENLKRLNVINLMKELGLTLTEIRQILTAKKNNQTDKETVQYLLRVFNEKLDLVNSKLEVFGRLKEELGDAIKILQSCRCCDHEVLLDAAYCEGCGRLLPKEKVPETFEVILQ
jgi:DNA-binding transcriptional MerR regulator